MKFSLSILTTCILMILVGCSKFSYKLPVALHNTNVKNYTYRCQDGLEIKVEYLTRGETDVAIVNVFEQSRRLFVKTISSSGINYVSGEYMWLIKGDIAYFYRAIDKKVECRLVSDSL